MKSSSPDSIRQNCRIVEIAGTLRNITWTPLGGLGKIANTKIILSRAINVGVTATLPCPQKISWIDCSRRPSEDMNSMNATPKLAGEGGGVGNAEPNSKETAVVSPKSLATKILEIQDAVGIVNKKGKFGSEMGGGNYLRIEDAVVAVNKLMSARKLIFYGDILNSERTPHERVGKDGNLARTGYISSVRMLWTVEDTETGEKRSWTFPGDGYDGTDKSVYKAMTGSRKYAIINIFNLPIGNDVEEHGTPTFEEGKAKQKSIAANKIAEAASRGVPAAIDAMSQVEPEKKLHIVRPDEYNGHYIIVSGFIAAPPLDTFFSDTGCKRIDSRKTGKTGWKVPAEYEKGLLALCERLNIEVEG